MKIKLTAGFLAAATVPAQAQTTNTVTTSVNASAGLAPVTTLTCDGVNFGVWRVPVRNSGGVTKITLTLSGANIAASSTIATPSVNTANVSLAPGYQPPAAGTCILVGSLTKSGGLGTSLTGTSMPINVSSNHESLPLPSIMADMTANLTLGGPGMFTDANGDGSFRITGVLTIPEIIVAENFGGYKTGDNAIAVSVSETNSTQTVMTGQGVPVQAGLIQASPR